MRIGSLDSSGFLQPYSIISQTQHNNTILISTSFTYMYIYPPTDDVTELRNLSRLPCLEAVVLEGNPIAEHPNYRIFVFAQLLCDGMMMDTGRDVPALDSQQMTGT